MGGWDAERRVPAEQKQFVEPSRPSVSPVEGVYTPVWSHGENPGMYEKAGWLGASAAVCPNDSSGYDTGAKESPARRTQAAVPETRPRKCGALRASLVQPWPLKIRQKAGGLGLRAP